MNECPPEKGPCLTGHFIVQPSIFGGYVGFQGGGILVYKACVEFFCRKTDWFPLVFVRYVQQQQIISKIPSKSFGSGM